MDSADHFKVIELRLAEYYARLDGQSRDNWNAEMVGSLLAIWRRQDLLGSTLGVPSKSLTDIEHLLSKVPGSESVLAAVRAARNFGLK